MNTDILTLTDTEGQELKYYIVLRFNAENRGYIALTPQSGTRDVIELFKCSDVGDDIIVTNIASNFELDIAKREYDKLIAQESSDLLSDYSDNSITLHLEDGSDCICDIISMFNFEGSDFIAVLPLEAVEADGGSLQIALFKCIETLGVHGVKDLSLSNIPVSQYPRVESYFMSLASEDLEE